MHRPPSLTRYDGLLAAMPVSVVGGMAAGRWLAIPLLAGVGIGAGVAAVMIGISIALMPTFGQKGCSQRGTYQPCDD
jgi:hypothetical protein